MKTFLFPALLGSMALTACVSFEETGAKDAMPEPSTQVPADQAGGFECDAAKAQYALGQKTSVELAKKLLKETGANSLRWIPPRTPVTMDYRGDRLNIGYDDAMVIDKISCG